MVAILTAPFLPARPSAADAKPVVDEVDAVDVPLHVHTGVWSWNMGAMPMARDGEPERLREIDEIPHMTNGERRLAREVELQHARLR